MWCFDISKCLLFGNGTLFVTIHMWQLLEKYEVDHMKSSSYYPHGNGQAKATNKTLLYILNKMIYEKPKR